MKILNTEEARLAHARQELIEAFCKWLEENEEPEEEDTLEPDLSFGCDLKRLVGHHERVSLDAILPLVERALEQLPIEKPEVVSANLVDDERLEIQVAYSVPYVECTFLLEKE